MQRYQSIFLVMVLVSLTSCTLFVRQKTLNEIKANKICITLRENIKWEDIEKSFSIPDIAPLPQEGQPLSSNTRIYEDKMIIFYTEREKVGIEGRIRFYEVVKKVEVCE